MATSSAMAGGSILPFPDYYLMTVPPEPPILWVERDRVMESLAAPTADATLGSVIDATARFGSRLRRPVGVRSKSSEVPVSNGSIRRFFYDQIFFDSSRVNFGAVGSRETREILVWNSFMVPVLFNGITLVEGDGTGITAQVSSAAVGDSFGYDIPPFMLPSLAYMTVFLSAVEIGPPEIFVRFRSTFTIEDESESGFVGEDTHDVTAIGIRARALLPRPNWENGLDESLESLTCIVPSHSGMEHRASMRDVARRRIGFDTLLSGDDASTLRSLLSSWQNRIFMCPLWQYEMRLPYAAYAEDSLFILETADIETSGIAVGGRVMFVAFGQLNKYEFLQVDSFTADTPVPGFTQINTTLPLKSSWSAGSMIYPGGMAFIEGDVSLNRYTQDVQTSRINLLFDPGTVNDFLPAASAPSAYTVTGSPEGSYEVLEQEPNWANDISASQQFGARVVDAVTGVYSLATTREFPSKTWAFSWLLRDRAMIKTFREFLGRRKGAWKSFMAPSWDTDFTVIRDIVLGQSFIVCQPNGFNSTVYSMIDKNFFVEVEYGAIKYRRKITGIDDTVEGEMKLALDAAIPVSIAAADVRAVRLLETYRLNSDKIDLKWLNPGVVTCDIEVTTVTENRRVI